MHHPFHLHMRDLVRAASFFCSRQQQQRQPIEHHAGKAAQLLQCQAGSVDVTVDAHVVIIYEVEQVLVSASLSSDGYN